MAQIFERNGTEFTGTALTSEKGKPFFNRRVPCGRCGGQARIDCYRHVEGGICFKCFGARFTGTETVALYTADKLANLNATADKRNARKIADTAAKVAAAQAEAEARREAFQAAHADVLPWLSAAAHDDAGNVRDGFLGYMWTQATKAYRLSEAQVSAIRASMERAKAAKDKAAASRHVGTVGERITLAVTVERESSYSRTAFGSWSGQQEEVFITTMRDAAGNALVVKSPSFRVPVGYVITLRGTVKDHSDFRGEAQTILQRASYKDERKMAA